MRQVAQISTAVSGLELCWKWMCSLGESEREELIERHAGYWESLSLSLGREEASLSPLRHLSLDKFAMRAHIAQGAL